MTIPEASALSGLVFLCISGVLGLAATSKRASRVTCARFRKGAWITFVVSGILFLGGIWGAAL